MGTFVESEAGLRKANHALTSTDTGLRPANDCLGLRAGVARLRAQVSAQDQASVPLSETPYICYRGGRNCGMVYRYLLTADGGSGSTGQVVREKPHTYTRHRHIRNLPGLCCFVRLPAFLISPGFRIRALPHFYCAPQEQRATPAARGGARRASERASKRARVAVVCRDNLRWPFSRNLVRAADTCMSALLVLCWVDRAENCCVGA